MPVAAGIVTDMFVPAMIATLHMSSHEGCPAILNLIQYVLLIAVGMIFPPE
jgi:hypothetical protein